ncbi:MAG: DUF3800 domain-containing protein [Patescibacteria group bacterium]
MWYLYLDESGDLGFDFVNKKPSKFFTVTILALSSYESNRKLIKAVKMTLRRKTSKKEGKNELKGINTTLDVKKYFYKQVKNIRFSLYSITLNKKRIFEELTRSKERVYNFIARQVLDEIPFEKANHIRIELIIDKSKSKPEIEEFNSYIKGNLEGRIEPKTPLDIYHWKSHENYGLQACDLFCWGIFQKYERKRMEWHDIFSKDEKIKLDSLYLP